MITQPHSRFRAAPSPAETEPPVITKDHSPTDLIVVFELDEHSIPAFPASVEVMAFVPATASVTELAEITMAALVLMLIIAKTTVILWLLISSVFAVEVPVTTIAPEYVVLRDVNLSVFFDSCPSSESTIICRPATVC
jgi:hypothetical protein